MKNDIIKYLGEGIFPQPFSEIDKLFDFDEVLQLAKEGLIQESKAAIGTNPAALKRVKRYIELSEKGWELYESLNENQS